MPREGTVSRAGAHRGVGSHLLLTGVTGFLGKVVLFELFRRRTELKIECIYVLVRPKAEVSSIERFSSEVTQSACFREAPPSCWDLVQVVEGDLHKADCGLDDVVRNELCSGLTHIIHCAASVEFELPIAEAARYNILGSLHILGLAQACPSLRRLVAVSTAYVTPHLKQGQECREVLGNIGICPDVLYERILSGRADEQRLLRKTGLPNTYTLTKCIAEHLLLRRRGTVPLSIVRPSIISASLTYPEPGWIDSRAAFAGFVALIGAGHLRTIKANPTTRVDIIPCDVVARVVIDAACSNENAQRVPNEIRYAVAGLDNSCTIEACANIVTRYFVRRPIDANAQLDYVGESRLSLGRVDFFSHQLPSLGGRIFAHLTGRTRMARQLKKLNSTRAYLNRAFPYFSCNTFSFVATNPCLNMDFDRRAYVELVCKGVYRNLFGRSTNEVPIGGRSHSGDLDMSWAMSQPEGNATIRAFGYVLRKLSRMCVEQVTFDHDAFERARAEVRPGERLVIVPTHRSYTDFLLCSYLFFSCPELGVTIPHIAADRKFAELPLLGYLFRSARAFYLKRGLGQPDPELRRKIEELVKSDVTLQFFVEGTRSRNRKFLKPRRGLLRCLQETGERFAILPVAISYDRIPEEAELLAEIAGLPKPTWQIAALLRWFASVLRGDIDLGRIHIACGHLQRLDASTDIPKLGDSIMGELQRNTRVSSHHVRSFLEHADVEGVDEAWLNREFAKRGSSVLDSSLESPEGMSPLQETVLRNQWLHRFYGDALHLFPGHPVIRQTVERYGFDECSTETRSGDSSQVLQAFVRELFSPLCRDYIAVARVLMRQADVSLMIRPIDVRAHLPGVELSVVEDAMEFFASYGVLISRGSGEWSWGEGKCDFENLLEGVRIS